MLLLLVSGWSRVWAVTQIPEPIEEKILPRLWTSHSFPNFQGPCAPVLHHNMHWIPLPVRTVTVVADLRSSDISHTREVYLSTGKHSDEIWMSSRGVFLQFWHTVKFMYRYTWYLVLRSVSRSFNLHKSTSIPSCWCLLSQLKIGSFRFSEHSYSDIFGFTLLSLCDHFCWEITRQMSCVLHAAQPALQPSHLLEYSEQAMTYGSGSATRLLRHCGEPALVIQSLG